MFEERLPPQNVQAEQSVLGAIFLAKDAYETASEILQPDDFYKTAHVRIFAAMAGLFNKGEPVDLVTVTAELQDKKLLDDVGGVTYLTDLAGSVPTAANIDYYARIVREKAELRRIIKTATRIVADGYDAESSQELVAIAEQQFSEINERSRTGNEFIPIREVLVETYDQIYLLSTRKSDITGVPSGYRELDELTGGFQKSDLIILAARPSVGKTAFALNVGQNVAHAGETVAVFSLEMSASQLVQRMLCAEGLIDAQKLKVGGLEEEDWEKLTKAIGLLGNAPIYIDDTPGVTVHDIRTKCRKLQKEKGLGLILIDYLQLIHSKTKANRQEQVSEISKALKNLARELKVPVIALSQLSRGVEQRQDKRPMLSDIRESGSIEQDADIVAFLYRDDYYNKESEQKNIVEVNIAKHRNGPTGTVELAFLKEFNKFVDLTPRQWSIADVPQEVEDEEEDKDKPWRS
ncbi:replicative DNA helicase [Brevibacillus brevis]|uniref:replicative DNA helicase n=1 Tax=Brevibacillus brevis TaxID=1393 RepID=UPI000D0E590B|nr:replicative DNA helicase [Brevibacillus brevis]PSJ66319.1 replicative DNA helicase [Brevibacillus brevis]RED21834.1 primary replicative DNA helicase [Brevibacillus brevis]GEC93074.1 replicative DNA helicase [Brevibacillus brevis]VEF92697.1 Replicative DNA helicase [Brevibacillus brevis]